MQAGGGVANGHRLSHTVQRGEGLLEARHRWPLGEPARGLHIAHGGQVVLGDGLGGVRDEFHGGAGHQMRSILSWCRAIQACSAGTSIHSVLLSLA